MDPRSIDPKNQDIGNYYPPPSAEEDPLNKTGLEGSYTTLSYRKEVRQVGEIHLTEEDIGRAKEVLAEAVHDIWSTWMEYVFSSCTQQGRKTVIPEKMVSQWKRQIGMGYTELPDEEKMSDLEIAQYYIDLLVKETGRGDQR